MHSLRFQAPDSIGSGRDRFGGFAPKSFGPAKPVLSQAINCDESVPSVPLALIRVVRRYAIDLTTKLFSTLALSRSQGAIPRP